MYNFIEEYWQDYLVELESRINAAIDEQERTRTKRKKRAVFKTEVCNSRSGEQNEEEKNSENWVLILKPHRKRWLIRDLEKEFKDVNPFRLVIVCTMWITGFDAPKHFYCLFR